MLDKNILLNKVEEGLSIRKLAECFAVAPSTIRYYLKKYSFSTKKNSQFNCEKCGEKDSRFFYGHRKSICKTCFNTECLEKGKQIRFYICNKMGNKCSFCHYDKYKSALAVHHLDPSKKDKTFKCHRGWSIERINKEISSCILLCSNCHIAYHAGEINIIATNS